MSPFKISPTCLVLLLTTFSSVLGQDAPVVCKRSELTALKPKPAFRYRCDPNLQPYDEKILKLAARIKAKQALMGQLETLVSPAWWQASTDDLNACDFRHKPGVITGEDLRNFKNDYLYWLFGDGNIRLIILSDPCYQSDYNGLVAFVLYHKGSRVFSTQVIDNFFSRADNPMLLEVVQEGSEEIVEVATWSGGLNASATNYYFSIDPKTHRAVAKNMFDGSSGPTNEISSALLLGDPEAFDLPADAVEIKVIQNNHLAKAISVYEDDSEGAIDANGRKLTRKVLKWNGEMYK